MRNLHDPAWNGKWRTRVYFWLHLIFHHVFFFDSMYNFFEIRLRGESAVQFRLLLMMLNLCIIQNSLFAIGNFARQSVMRSGDVIYPMHITCCASIFVSPKPEFPSPTWDSTVTWSLLFYPFALLRYRSLRLREIPACSFCTCIFLLIRVLYPGATATGPAVASSSQVSIWKWAVSPWRGYGEWVSRIDLFLWEVYDTTKFGFSFCAFYISLLLLFFLCHLHKVLSWAVFYQLSKACLFYI